MAKRVCMLTTDHCAKDDRIYFKEALTLANAGYEVHILILVAEDGFARGMGGEILNSKGESTFSIGEIYFHTVKTDNSLLSKLLNKFFIASYQRSLIQKAIAIEADVYHAHEPQSLYLGFQVCKILKTAKLVLDAHESWIKRGWKNWITKKSVIPNLKYLISANEITRGYLLNLNYQIKAVVVQNSAVFNHDGHNAVNNTRFRMVHEGSMKFDRGLKLILETIKGLKDKEIDFCLDVLGSIQDEEKAFFTEFVAEHGLSQNIKLLGHVPYEELPEKLNGYDLGLIMSTPTTNNYLAGPANKLFNYVAANIPVLSMDIPETTRIINEYKIGKIIFERDALKLAAEIELLINSDSLIQTFQSNIAKNKNYFLWKHDEKKLLDFYASYLN